MAHHKSQKQKCFPRNNFHLSWHPGLSKKYYVFIISTTFEMIAFNHSTWTKNGREEGKIYHIRYFNLLPNNQRYILTVQPYIININETTIITLIEKNIPPIPSYIFRPQCYPQLIILAIATNFLPGKKKPLLVSQTIKFSFFSLKTNYFPRCCWPKMPHPRKWYI